MLHFTVCCSIIYCEFLLKTFRWFQSAANLPNFSLIRLKSIKIRCKNFRGCFFIETQCGVDGKMGVFGWWNQSLSVGCVSGCRQACRCDGTLEPAEDDDDDEVQPSADITLVPTHSSSRVCVVQGLLRNNDDSGLAVEVGAKLRLSWFCSYRMRTVQN